MEPLFEEGDELMEPLFDDGDVTELIDPELIEPSFDLLVGVGATTATGDGAGSIVPAPDGAVTGDVTGAGTIPEQQSRKTPSAVGQQSPINPNEAQTG